MHVLLQSYSHCLDTELIYAVFLSFVNKLPYREMLQFEYVVLNEVDTDGVCVCFVHTVSKKPKLNLSLCTVGLCNTGPN